MTRGGKKKHDIIIKNKFRRPHESRRACKQVPAGGQDDFVGFKLRLFADQRDVHEGFVLQEHFDGVHHVDQVIVPPETVLRRVHIS